MSTGLRTKGSPVQFPVRAHAWVAGQVPSWGRARGNLWMYLLHIGVCLPLCPSIPSPKTKIKKNFKIWAKKGGADTVPLKDMGTFSFEHSSVSPLSQPSSKALDLRGYFKTACKHPVSHQVCLNKPGVTTDQGNSSASENMATDFLSLPLGGSSQRNF